MTRLPDSSREHYVAPGREGQLLRTLNYSPTGQPANVKVRYGTVPDCPRGQWPAPSPQGLSVKRWLQVWLEVTDHNGFCLLKCVRKDPETEG